MTLPEDMLAIANRESNEEAWRPSDFPRILELASAHRLACIGGQFEFCGPLGTAELYWLNAAATPRERNEDWGAYVARANSEVLDVFQSLIEQTDFCAEVQELEHISELFARGAIPDLKERLYFVAHFSREAAKVEPHGSKADGQPIRSATNQARSEAVRGTYVGR